MPLLLCAPTRYSTCNLKFQKLCSEIKLLAPPTLLIAPSLTVHPSSLPESSAFHPERSRPLNRSIGLPSCHEPSSRSLAAGAREPVHLRSASSECNEPSNLPPTRRARYS